VAFTWDGDKLNWDIYIKLIGTSGVPLRLTKHPARDYSPAWSPDSRFIAFLRNSTADKAELLLIPALGGPERKVAEISAWGFLPCPRLAWSSEPNFLVMSNREAPGEPGSLFLLSVDNGEKRTLTFPGKGAIHTASDSQRRS
jgi:Tol biopolymer transport system component